MHGAPHALLPPTFGPQAPIAARWTGLRDIAAGPLVLHKRKWRHRGIKELVQRVVNGQYLSQSRLALDSVFLAIMLDCVTLHLFINSKITLALSGMFCSTKALILLLYLFKIPHSPHKGLYGIPIT